MVLVLHDPIVLGPLVTAAKQCVSLGGALQVGAGRDEGRKEGRTEGRN